ncbi:hypothetical protein FB451DRAFT_1359031 [Mycena latifolia]|nr:hypothetical protein FB451DRAFT_1359031 [Mycena latifolia]
MQQKWGEYSGLRSCSGGKRSEIFSVVAFWINYNFRELNFPCKWNPLANWGPSSPVNAASDWRFPMRPMVHTAIQSPSMATNNHWWPATAASELSRWVIRFVLLQPPTYLYATDQQHHHRGDKTGVCLSSASNVLAANSKSKTRVPCLFGGDESRCFDKARRSFNNRKQIDLIVDNEYNGVYGPEQTTSTVLTVYMVDLGLVNPSGRNGNRPNELYKRD